MAFSLAYVGNRSEHIMGSRQFNPAVFGPGATVAMKTLTGSTFPGLLCTFPAELRLPSKHRAMFPTQCLSDALLLTESHFPATSSTTLT